LLQHSRKKDQENSSEWVPWQTIVRNFGEAEAVRRLHKGTIASQADSEDPGEHVFRMTRCIDRQYIQQYITFDTTKGCLETSCHSYYNMMCHVSDTTRDISYVIMLLYLVHRQFDTESKTFKATNQNKTNDFEQIEHAADNPDAIVQGPGGASQALLKHLGVSKAIRNTHKNTDTEQHGGRAMSIADSGVSAQAAMYREMAARLETRGEGRGAPYLGHGERATDSESPKGKAKGKAKGKGKGKAKAKAKAKGKAKSKAKAKGKNEKEKVPDDKKDKVPDDKKDKKDNNVPDEKGERGDTTTVDDKHAKLISLCKVVEERCGAAVRKYDKSSVDPTKSMLSKYEQVKAFEQKLATETGAHRRQDKSNCYRGNEAVIIL
jgi:hypothetical protein